MGDLSAEQKRTIQRADEILNAPAEHIDKEIAQYPAAFMEILEVLADHLSTIHEVGVGWRVVQIEILKLKAQGQKGQETLALEPTG